jgi:hypothetical protein
MMAFAYSCLLAIPVWSIAAGLDGAAVTVTGYCCSGAVEADRFTDPATAIVGPGIEFPSGSIVLTTSRDLIRSNIDVSAFAIDLQYTDTNTAAVAPFNGYGFDFSGLGPNRIAGVALNPLSSFAAGSIGLGFDKDSVFYSGAGLSFSPGSRVLIDVALSPVPEPGAWMMLLAGMSMLAPGLRNRRRRARYTAAREVATRSRTLVICRSTRCA